MNETVMAEEPKAEVKVAFATRKYSNDEKRKAEEEEARAALSRIETSTDVNAVADCDLVIEAIVENLPIKLEFFENLGKITSSITINMQIKKTIIKIG